MPRPNLTQHQALTICQFISNRQGEAISLNRVASLYKEVGNYELAMPYIEQAISIHRDIGDEQGVAEDLQVLGTIHLMTEEYEIARTYLEQALEICQRSRNKIQEGVIWLELAVALEELGNLDEASNAYEQAKNLQEELGNNINALDARIGLARCLLAGGKIEDALQTVQNILGRTRPKWLGDKISGSVLFNGLSNIGGSKSTTKSYSRLRERDTSCYNIGLIV